MPARIKKSRHAGLEAGEVSRPRPTAAFALRAERLDLSLQRCPRALQDQKTHRLNLRCLPRATARAGMTFMRLPWPESAQKPANGVRSAFRDNAPVWREPL